MAVNPSPANAFPSVLQTLVGLFFAEQAQDAWDDAYDKIDDFADRQVDMAKILYEKYKDLDGVGNALYSAQTSCLPYERCEDSTAARRYADVMRTTTDLARRSTARFTRSQRRLASSAIRQSMMIGAQEAVSAKLDARRYEDALSDAAYVECVQACVDAASPVSQYGTLAGSYRTVSQYYQSQLQAAAAQYNGALTTIGYGIGGIINSFRYAQQSQSLPVADTTINYNYPSTPFVPSGGDPFGGYV